MELLKTIGYFTTLSGVYLMKNLFRIEKLKNLYKVEELKD